MKKLLFVFLLLSARAYGKDITAATCNTPDVQAAINSSVAGDRVVVPAGNCTWLISVEIVDKPITLWADGVCTNCGTKAATWAGNTHITCGWNHCLVIKNKIGDRPVEVAGLHLTCTANSETVVYNEGWHFNIHDMKFESQALCSTTNFGQLGYSYYASGVYQKNLNINVRHLLRGVNDGSRDEWRQPSTIGQPNQDYVVYIETSTFLFTTFGNVVDHENGARGAFRHNYAQNVYLEVHGIHVGGDGLIWPQGRSYEIYDNVFECLQGFQGSGQCYMAMRLRSGTGVVFNNQVLGFFDGAILLDNQRSDIDFGGLNGKCGGSSVLDGNQDQGWPCDGQPGRGQIVGVVGVQPQLSEPLYAANNTFNGQPVEPLVIGSNAIKTCPTGWGSQCDIMKGRDFFIGTRPGYTTYPYPYPPFSDAPPIPIPPIPIPPNPTPQPTSVDVYVNGQLLGSGGLPLTLTLKKNCSPGSGCKVEVKQKP